MKPITKTAHNLLLAGFCRISLINSGIPLRHLGYDFVRLHGGRVQICFYRRSHCTLKFQLYQFTKLGQPLLRLASHIPNKPASFGSRQQIHEEINQEDRKSVAGAQD
jgi:hypothetical protein